MPGHERAAAACPGYSDLKGARVKMDFPVQILALAAAY